MLWRERDQEIDLCHTGWWMPGRRFKFQGQSDDRACISIKSCSLHTCSMNTSVNYTIPRPNPIQHANEKSCKDSKKHLGYIIYLYNCFLGYDFSYIVPYYCCTFIIIFCLYVLGVEETWNQSGGAVLSLNLSLLWVVTLCDWLNDGLWSMYRSVLVQKFKVFTFFTTNVCSVHFFITKV